MAEDYTAALLTVNQLDDIGDLVKKAVLLALEDNKFKPMEIFNVSLVAYQSYMMMYGVLRSLPPGELAKVKHVSLKGDRTWTLPADAML